MLTGERCFIMKALLAALVGLLGIAGTFFLLFEVKIDIRPQIDIRPKMNNIFVIGSNNNVNPTIDSRSPNPLPQPTVQAQSTPLPVDPAKELPSVNEETGKEKTSVEPNNTVTKADPAEIAYTKAPVKQRPVQKNRSVSNDSNDYYPVSTKNSYRDNADFEDDACSCPADEISSESYDTGGGATIYQRIRPGTSQYSRSEQRQETVINGVRTVRRTVTVTNNGQTKTYVYDN